MKTHEMRPHEVVGAFLALLVSVNLPSTAWASDDAGRQLVGTWKLSTWVVQVVGENTREPFGPSPKGRLVLTPDGYWIVIITGANRQPGKTAEEKAVLLDSLLAYSGKYTVEGDKVTTKVDISSNEVFAGANQVQTRFFKIDGDTLVIRTPEIESAALPGKRVIGTLRFERQR